ncbi:MAG TPA: hypothetical protein VFS47_11625, partial [Steroidobacteraceae bacterium]|nr:hypothetical protein [Steroidobacteraceae bacterium]
MLVDRNRFVLRTTVRAILGIASLPLAASMANAQTQASSDSVEEVVVTGYRESLNRALNIKRESVGAVDSIVAEDI